MKALKEYGVEYKEEMVEIGDYRMESGHLLSKRLVDKGASAILHLMTLWLTGSIGWLRKTI